MCDDGGLEERRTGSIYNMNTPLYVHVCCLAESPRALYSHLSGPGISQKDGSIGDSAGSAVFGGVAIGGGGVWGRLPFSGVRK